MGDYLSQTIELHIDCLKFKSVILLGSRQGLSNTYMGNTFLSYKDVENPHISNDIAITVQHDRIISLKRGKVLHVLLIHFMMNKKNFNEVITVYLKFVPAS